MSIPARLFLHQRKTADASFLLGALLVLLPCCSTPGSRMENPEPPADALDRVLGDLEDTRSSGGNIEPQLNALSELSVRYPRDVDILMANAVFSFERGAYSVAREFTDRIFRVESSHPEAAILRVRLALREGNSGFARRFLKEQILLRPDHPELHETMACVHFLDGKKEEARSSLKRSERLGGVMWRIHYHRGVLLETEAKPDLAAQAYSRALELNSSHQLSRQRYRGVTGKDWKPETSGA